MEPATAVTGLRHCQVTPHRYSKLSPVIWGHLRSPKTPDLNCRYTAKRGASCYARYI